MGERLASRADIARLFGRAAFGATSANLDAWAGKPYADAVGFLLDVPPPGLGRVQLDDIERSAVGGLIGRSADSTAAGQIKAARQWWLERMRTTKWPLLERLVLFWHDHFATGLDKPYPDLAMMTAQNELLRTHALGNFRAFVTAMNIDPAMLYWLNGAQSAPPHPNENYARELFELFTLGKYPQVYTEDDIREAARALTGWVVDLNARTPKFDARRHDAGTKRILGATVTNQADQEHLAVAKLALDHPVSTRFIAYKLVRNFAYEPDLTDVTSKPDPLVRKVADALRRSDWNIAAGVREMLLADEFRYSSSQQVRQPVELTVHAAKSLDIAADSDQAIQALDGMGQRLYDPPNVGGWPAGATWLSPGTMLSRYALAVADQQAAGGGALRPFPASGDFGAWAARLGLPGFTPNTEAALRSFLASRDKAPEAERQQGVLILLLTSPDWMVM